MSLGWRPQIDQGRTVDGYVAYRGKKLRYSFLEGELQINSRDLCSIVGVDLEEPDSLDLLSAFHLIRSHDTAFAKWLLETFKNQAPAALKASEPWLYSEMQQYLNDADQ